MFCKFCGKQIDENNTTHGEAICPECRESKLPKQETTGEAPEKVVLSARASAVPSLNRWRLPAFAIEMSKDQILRAGILTIFVLAFQFVLSFLTTVIGNALLSKQMDSLLSQMADDSVSIKPLHTWLVLRYSTLNTFHIKMSYSVLGLVGHVKMHLQFQYMYLLLVPALAFLGAWLVYEKGLSKKLGVLEPKSALVFTTAFYAFFFVVTSFIPTTLMKTEELKMTIHYSILSSFLGSILVGVFMSSLMSRLLKRRSKFDTVPYQLAPMATATVRSFMRFTGLLALVSTLGVCITSATQGMSAFKTTLAVLPNAILIRYQYLLGGIYKGNSSQLAKVLNEFMPDSIWTVVPVLIVTVVLFGFFLLAFEEAFTERGLNAWKRVVVTYVEIALLQIMFYFVGRIRFTMSGLEALTGGAGNNFTISANLILSLIILAFVVFVPAVVCAYMNQTALKGFLGNLKKMKKPVAIGCMIAIFVLAIITGISQNSKSAKSSDDAATKLFTTADAEDEDDTASSKEVYGAYPYNGGYLLDFGEDYFALYKNNTIKKAAIQPKNSYVSIEATSNESDKYFALDNGVVSLYTAKGEVVDDKNFTCDAIAAVSDDMTKVAYWSGSTLYYYDYTSKEEQTVTSDSDKLELVDTSVVFKKDGTGLYLGTYQDGIYTYTFQTKELSAPDQQYLEVIVAQDGLYGFTAASQAPLNVEDGTKAAYYYKEAAGMDSTTSTDAYNQFYKADASGTDTMLFNKLLSIDRCNFRTGDLVFSYGKILSENQDLYLYEGAQNKLVNLTSEVRSATKMHVLGEDR